MPSISPLGRVGLALLALAGSVAADNKLTTTPADFRGFYILPNGAVSTVTCASGFTFLTSSTYGACCNGDNCNYGTACASGTVNRILGGTSTCDTSFPNCYTMTVYASYPSADQSWLVRGCANSLFSASTIYREIVTDTTSTRSSTGASSRSTSTLPGPTKPADSIDDDQGGSGQITAPPTGLPTQTGTPQPSTGGGGSKAWIAGVVVGPLAGLALIGLVAVWLMKRRKAANENHHVAVAGDAKPDHSMAPSMADQSSMHPSAYGYYGAGSPAPGSPPPVKYYQGEPPVGLASTPSPVNGNGYVNPQQGMYPQQAAYGVAPYPPQQGQQYSPQQGQYQPQHSPQPSQYSPQPYPAQFATPPPPMNGYQPVPQQVAELASGPMGDPPQELGGGRPVQR